MADRRGLRERGRTRTLTAPPAADGQREKMMRGGQKTHRGCAKLPGGQLRAVCAAGLHGMRGPVEGRCAAGLRASARGVDAKLRADAAGLHSSAYEVSRLMGASAAGPPVRASTCRHQWRVPAQTDKGTGQAQTWSATYRDARATETLTDGGVWKLQTLTYADVYRVMCCRVQAQLGRQHIVGATVCALLQLREVGMRR